MVFDSLDLTNFGNRIPALTFEVFADNLSAGADPLNLGQIFAGLLNGVDANLPLRGITGFSHEGTFGDTLAKFQAIFPLSCAADGTRISIAPAARQAEPIALSDAALPETEADFGGTKGLTAKRAAPPIAPQRVLRFYDAELDYQPGVQRAFGQPGQGEPKPIAVPAAMTAATAFLLVSQAATNANWARETLAYRSASLDPAIVPGTTVTVPGQAGDWTVTQWEWRAGGIELMLERLAPPSTSASIPTSGGSGSNALDLPIGTSALIAYELPWNGVGSADTPTLYAAVSSSSAGWPGAALYVDQGNGALAPIGVSGRARSTIGATTNALAAASPLLFDRSSTLTVQLLGLDMALTSASPDQLIGGTNQALVGSEIIQFCSASALGGGLWRLSGLLRGRGGTEANIAGHAVGEAFVLLDANPVALDPALVGRNGGAKIAALGLADTSAVENAITNRGISLQPLSPVQPSAVMVGGSLTLAWTRRARGGWLWLDGVDEPLVEETEAYLVTYGPLASPIAMWNVTTPSLTLAAATLGSLAASHAGGPFYAQQIGTYGMSDALYLTHLA